MFESQPKAPGSKRVATRRRLTVDEYQEGITGGRREVLSRAITLVESQSPRDRVQASELVTRILPLAGRSKRVGITGVPGAGKSTLIETLGLNLTERGHRVAVLAVDPSSRVSGGSILGDKTRMSRLSQSERAFIRPSPSGATLGGVARATREAMLLCEAAGYDVILVETVGVGQSETVVAGMVDFFLLVLIAGAGDGLQGIKRGVVEMADLIAINKADGDNVARARRAVQQCANALRLMRPAEDGLRPMAMACSALANEGLDRLWDQVETHRVALERLGLFESRRREQMVGWMWDLVRDEMERKLRESESVRAVAGRMEAAVREYRVPPSSAAEAIVEALGAGRGPVSGVELSTPEATGFRPPIEPSGLPAGQNGQSVDCQRSLIDVPPC